MRKSISLVCSIMCFAVSVGPVCAQTKVAIASSPSADYLPAWVAQEEGFFRKHGLDSTTTTVMSSTILAGLQSGSLQVAGVPPAAMLTANEGGLDLVAIAGASVSSKTGKNFGILVAADSGIKNGKDLVGKKIGVPAISGMSYVLTRKYVADSGLAPNQVSFIEVGMPQAGDALKSKSVQASVTAAPFIQRAVQNSGASVLAYFDSIMPEGTQITPFTATREWAARNPAAVQGFRAAIAEAIQFIEKNPQAAKVDLAKYTKLPPEVIANTVLPHYVAKVTEEDMRYWVKLDLEEGQIHSEPKTNLVAP
jgi:NitT/TauT family transport system substrate-binding protein